MQYSFTLPEDYDMGIIERRVADKGTALDHHEPLIFKTYAAAKKGDAKTRSNENLYAPFYLWRDTAGMNDFLCGPGFKGLVQSFGWPVVRSFPIVLASETAAIKRATFALREVVQLAPYTPLDALRAAERAAAAQAVADGAVGAVAALEPATWTVVRFRAWAAPQDEKLSSPAQAYEVLHVSHPSSASA